MLADTGFVILLGLLDSDRWLLDNGSLLGGMMRALLVVPLDHCDRDVLVLGGSALELHDTVEDDTRTQRRRTRIPMPHLKGEFSRRFSD